MYPNSHPAQALSSPYVTPAFGEFTGYHHHHHVAGFGEYNGAWSPQYVAQRDEWSLYGHSVAGSSPGAGQVAYSSPDFLRVPAASGVGSHPMASCSVPPGQDSSNSQGENSYESVRHGGHPSSSGGKTRTKDKYRVVYTDHQRLELEREFQYNRYIASSRKAELSLEVGLSERQVKIWFQNRRAKERKLNRKNSQLSHLASTATSTSPVLIGHTNAIVQTSPRSNILSDTPPAAATEEF